MELVALAKNPVPSGATTGMLKCPNGIELRFARWAFNEKRQDCVRERARRRALLQKFGNNIFADDEIRQHDGIDSDEKA